MAKIDKRIKKILKAEVKRQNEGIELIASENYPSRAVMKLCGTPFMWKYAEGYPAKRYYGGCENVDAIETLAIEMAKNVFHSEYANVQPHSGSQANAAAYRALEKLLLEKGQLDGYRKMKVLSMDLNSGSHLTHGSPVSFSSNVYDFVFFDLGPAGKINFSILYDRILEEKPDVVLCGYSAYPYTVHFEKFRETIEKAKKKLHQEIYLMADIAHIAGLIAGAQHMNPMPFCDIVTTTTHKTLRGPRGGMILWNNDELTKKVNSAVFPYYQGGPFENVIAAKAQMLIEASSPKFRDYALAVKKNTSKLRDELKKLGAKVSGTENHLFLLNTLDSFELTGLDAQKRLEAAGITTNKNMIPGDTLSPAKTSGLRIGLAAVTTRGITKAQIVKLARIIYYVLSGNISTEEAKKEVLSISKHLKKVR